MLTALIPQQSRDLDELKGHFGGLFSVLAHQHGGAHSRDMTAGLKRYEHRMKKRRPARWHCCFWCASACLPYELLQIQLRRQANGGALIVGLYVEFKRNLSK
ncbi:hypothetical protein [Acinetobacter sp.]|uniref:hypothetical protein n=1 Tax=Acinetobacter sp. TaxID=472 RepID=UPI0035AF1AAE